MDVTSQTLEIMFAIRSVTQLVPCGMEGTATAHLGALMTSTITIYVTCPALLQVADGIKVTV